MQGMKQNEACQYCDMQMTGWLTSATAAVSIQLQLKVHNKAGLVMSLMGAMKHVAHGCGNDLLGDACAK